MLYLGILELELKKTIVIFEIGTLEFVKNESLTQAVTFGIGSTFYKVCLIRIANHLFHVLIYPQPIVITSTAYEYNQKVLHSHGNQLLNSNSFHPKI